MHLLNIYRKFNTKILKCHVIVSTISLVKLPRRNISCFRRVDRISRGIKFITRCIVPCKFYCTRAHGITDSKIVLSAIVTVNTRSGSFHADLMENKLFEHDLYLIISFNTGGFIRATKFSFNIRSNTFD